MGDPGRVFAVRLARAMKRAGLTQTQLAEALGTGQSTVQGWTGGKSYPGGEYLVRLPKLLNVSGHYLLTGELPEEPPGAGTAWDLAFRAGWVTCAEKVRQAVTEAAKRPTGAPAAGEMEELDRDPPRKARKHRKVG